MAVEGVPMIQQITFVPNSPDDKHCLPAAVAMAVQGTTYRSVSMTEAEKLTLWDPKLPTWQFAAILAMARMDLHVIDAEKFSPEEFAADPEATLRKQVGDKATADWIVQHTDLEKEVNLVKECLAEPNVEFRDIVPTFDDLKKEIDSGAALICNVNSKALSEREGYVGHQVVLLDVTEAEVELHDPGLPARPNHRVSRDTFLKAWQYPSETMANFISIRSVQEN